MQREKIKRPYFIIAFRRAPFTFAFAPVCLLVFVISYMLNEKKA